MQKIRELFVLLEDKPGAIYELTRLLKKQRVNILAIGLFIDTARLLVDNPDKALAALLENNYTAEMCEVLSIRLPNRQGALMDVTQKFSNAGINIKYLYGTMDEGQKRGRIMLEVDNPDLALAIFATHEY